MESSGKIKDEAGKNSIEKVDWLYEKRGHDAEEYLMGKRFEELKEDTTEDQVPGFDDAILKRSELDMKLKMREDPLYSIKLKEEEARRRILDNPLKLKKLNSLKEKKKHKSEKQKTKKSHKEKSNKKERDGKRNKDDDSDEETNNLLKKYMSLKKNNQGKEEKMVSTKKGSRSGNDSASDDSEDHRKQYGLNIKRKYAMSSDHEKIDYSKLNFKTAKPSSSKREKSKLTEEEKEEKRRKMMQSAEEKFTGSKSK